MSKRRVDIKPPPCTYCGTEDDFFSNPVLYWYDGEADWKTYACGKCTIKALKGYKQYTKVLVAILKATDDPEQPGETQRLADVSQIVIEFLLDIGYYDESPQRNPSN